MFPISLLIMLVIGTGVMFVPIFVQSRWRGIKFWKSVIITLMLAITGVIGIYLWFFVENLEFGGRSFYGAVFLVPIICIFFSRILNIPYGALTDISAPAGCAMLAVMKIKCLMDDCCNGIKLYSNADGIAVYFPSQIVELINAAIIFVILMLISYKSKNRGKVYAWFLILYGATRFVLNFFRMSARPYVWIIPAGHFWSLFAIAIGIIWLIVQKKKDLSRA